MKEKNWSRRNFIRSAGLGAIALGFSQAGCTSSKKAAQKQVSPPVIKGFERDNSIVAGRSPWEPFSERKLRVGIAGYGVCRFGADFGFQNHPNVEIVAVTDLFPDRCDALAKVCGCSKKYPSIEEMVRDERIEAVFVATDAPSHANHVIEALKYGKHVASAVPAVFGSLEDADKLFEAVKKSGLKYMMFETSCFHQDLYGMRMIYETGGLGKIVYAEGEYYHYMSEPIDSYKGWRIGLPPQWYPTHSNAYYIGVNDGYFTEVSCQGMPSIIHHLNPGNNIYKNPFGTEIALFRTNSGGTARMAVSWDTPGDEGEKGRIRGDKGSYYGNYQGLEKNLPDISKPALPPGVPPGGHGGSHGYLMNNFVESVILDRTPLVNIAVALNLTVSGIVAHQSALRDGEVMKIPHYSI
ncbi:MAG TPA: Gfo/Idh/MocA family oxidoreductase [Bacteroidales bacterium]|nr:Gfo/Idh/MocA family oxidoreductase [Bacteroidales bacterium]